MNKTLTAITLAALLPAGVALAEDNDCSMPHDQWQPREAAMQVAERNRWTVRDFEADDGCYKIEGRDSSGREFEAKLDPATLQVVEMEYEDDDERGGARNPVPGSTITPPQNGLFGNGALPQVQVK